MDVMVFCDFDGTITRRDSLVTLFDAYVGPERRRQVDRRFHAGELPLWQLIDTSLRACAIPLEEALRYLHATIELDPSFLGFKTWCQARAVPLEVVSAGLHEIVESFLADFALPITANRAEPCSEGFGLRPLMPDVTTGVDKAGLVRAARERGRYAVFIGDGLSDRLAVAEADLVYAKAGLARYCQERAVPFVPFASFDDIRQDLTGRFPTLASDSSPS